MKHVLDAVKNEERRARMERHAVNLSGYMNEVRKAINLNDPALAAEDLAAVLNAGLRLAMVLGELGHPVDTDHVIRGLAVTELRPTG